MFVNTSSDIQSSFLTFLPHRLTFSSPWHLRGHQEHRHWSGQKGPWGLLPSWRADPKWSGGICLYQGEPTLQLKCLSIVFHCLRLQQWKVKRNVTDLDLKMNQIYRFRKNIAESSAFSWHPSSGVTSPPSATFATFEEKLHFAINRNWKVWSVCKCASQVSIQKQAHDIGDLGTFNLFRRPAKTRGGRVLNSCYCMPSQDYLFISIYNHWFSSYSPYLCCCCFSLLGPLW